MSTKLKFATLLALATIFGSSIDAQAAQSLADSNTASPITSRAIRHLRQPIARRVTISPRRSNTVIAIVFITPIAPMTIAKIDVNHDIVRVMRICVIELTNSAQGVAAISGSNASIFLRISGVIRWVRLSNCGSSSSSGGIALGSATLLPSGNRWMERVCYVV